MCQSRDRQDRPRLACRTASCRCEPGIAVRTPARRAEESPPTAPDRRRWMRGLGLVVTLFLVLVAAPGHAVAEPVDPATVPAPLRQYVPDSAEWMQAPWMTADHCRDRGGDWSTYTAHLIKDFPALLDFFQPKFAGIDGNAPEREKVLVRGYRDIAATLTVPTGYCVDQVKSWATANPAYQPFGFEWGNVDNRGEHGVRPLSKCSTGNPDDLAPCRGFYLACDGAKTQQDDQRCQSWNGFSDDYVRRMNTVVREAYNQHNVLAEDDDQTRVVLKSPDEIAQEFLDWVAKEGMEQVVSFIVSGVSKLWGVFMRIAVDYSAPQTTGAAFASVYNLVAGVAIALAFLGWLVTLASSWRRGHLQFSLFGGIKAAVGVTLAGVGAILMLELANDCTRSLVAAGGDIAQQADFTGSLVKVNPLVAILAGVLIAISLIFSVIFLVVSSALVLMWTLFGSFAAAGQVHPATSGWIFKWAARLTALAWAKFFMVAVMLLSQALLLPLEPGEDPVEQVVDVVQGLALCLLLVFCPWLLWELVDFVGDRIGGAAASGGVAGRVASRSSGRGVSLVGGAGGAAVRAMVASARELGRGGAGGGQDGAGDATNSHPRGRRPSAPLPDTAAHGGAAGSPNDGGDGEREGAETTPPTPASVGDGGGGGAGGRRSDMPPANRGRVVARARPRTPVSAADTRPADSAASAKPAEREVPRRPPPAD